MPSESNAFKPIKVGPVTLSNRVVLAPLTRTRATEDHVPTDLMLKHYDDRSKTPGSLVITDATHVHEKAAGLPFFPGMFNEKHVKAWRKITDKVHENKSFISLQLLHPGRAASVEHAAAKGLEFVGPSDIYPDAACEELAKKLNYPLKPITKEQIKSYVKIFADAAEKSINEAGFDLVEVHAGNGCLFDQFFVKEANNRTDEYGGSIENRSRFFLEVIDAIIDRIGGYRVACRLTQFTAFLGMPGIDADPSPYAQFGYVFGELEKRREKHGFAYVSTVEPRFTFVDDFKEVRGSNDFVFDIFKGNVIRAGSYISDEGKPVIDQDVNKNDRTLVAIGRWSTSNPDFVEKLKYGWELTKYDRDTFYVPGNWGYNTFPRHGEVKTYDEEAEKKNMGVPLA